MIDYQAINLINGVIDVNDRGLAYGDGIFETIAYVNGALHNWDLHWQRLCTGAERLSLSIPDETFFLNSINLKLLQNNDLGSENLDSGNLGSDKLDSQHRVIKIIITRGKGGRGYQFPQQAQTSMIISIHQWPERLIDDYKKGIRVKVCQTCLAQQPALAGIKHLNRLEQVLARNEFDGKDYHDGIMLACSDESSQFRARVIEATSSNLFFVKNGQLFTPKIDTCGVQGTIRQEIFQLAKKMSISIEQDHYTLSELSDASDVFFSNSIFGIVPMASITCSDNTQWFYSQQNKQRISAALSSKINKALSRPVLL
ncbi:MAG: aminodeoxychorismate lyase [gamma proteobacterium symbiont of Lucinoma myriamae]|nr:aminodeoxychorismate lyase [gamma proteobacterium symbiont of Lucinoma myriamae]